MRGQNDSFFKFQFKLVHFFSTKSRFLYMRDLWYVSCFFVPSPEMCSRYVWENPRSRTGNSQQEREFLLFEFTSKQKKLSAKKTAAVSVTYPITFSLISAQAFSGWEPEQCKSPLPQLTEGGIVQNRSRPGEGDTEPTQGVEEPGEQLQEGRINPKCS